MLSSFNGGPSAQRRHPVGFEAGAGHQLGDQAIAADSGPDAIGLEKTIPACWPWSQSQGGHASPKNFVLRPSFCRVLVCLDNAVKAWCSMIAKCVEPFASWGGVQNGTQQKQVLSL